MRKLIFLILFEICLFQQLSSQSHSLWVGESYTCDGTSAMMGLTSDKSWTTSGGYISLSGSGAYRTVTVTQYFSGTASVTFSWKERLYANDQWTQRSKTWYFTCKENPVYITPTSMTLAVGESGYVSYQHEYSNNYTNAANAYFSSSNSTIASVSSSGKVIGVSPGTTYINVYSKIANASKAPYCKVTVKSVDIQSVTVKPDPISIIAGEKKELQYTIYPSNATVNNISWYTNDKTIATISSTGVLTAVKHGTTEVYCIVNNSVKSNEVIVNVSKPTLQLSASQESGLLLKGTSLTLTANNTNAEIYYTIDGSTPSKSSTRYNGSIIINKNLTLKAIAYHKDYNTSSVLVRKFQVTSLEVVETFPTEKTIKKHEVPYIKFNSDVKLGNVEINVSTSAINNAIDNILLSNNVVYFIPQENAMTEGDILTIDIPEGAFIDKNTEERCVASKITLSITDSSSPYSRYAKEVYAGSYRSSALLSDGTLLSWGRNPVENRSWTMLKNIQQDYNVNYSCQGSNHHNAYIDNNGDLYLWGFNDWGCIGNGNNEDYYSYNSKYKAMSNVKEVACGGGDSFTLALTNDGILYGWGSNLFYQLTSATNKYFNVPQKIMTDVKHIYAGERASFIIKNDNSLWLRGSFSISKYPYYIICNNWKKVADDVIYATTRGSDFPLYITSDNTLYYCSDVISEYNKHYDSDRDENHNFLSSDLYTYKITTDVINASGSYYGGMYIKKNGSLWSWGTNSCGQLGNGTIQEWGPYTKPSEATKIMENIKKVSTSSSHSLILKEDGSIWGCGNGKYGNIKPAVITENILTPVLIWESEKAPSVENIEIKTNQTNITKRTHLPLQLIIEPSEAFYEKITWESSNQSVATVSERRIVFGISPGFTTITAIVESYDGKVFQDSQNIRIQKPFSGVEQIQDEEIHYSIDNSVLQLNNLKIGSMVNIYKVTGTKCYQGIANSQNMNIPLREKGFYIISIGNQRIKIANY